MKTNTLVKSGTKRKRKAKTSTRVLKKTKNDSGRRSTRSSRTAEVLELTSTYGRSAGTSTGFPLEEGIRVIKNDGVDAIIAMIERNNQADFKVDRYMNVKDVVFAMCVQREPNNFSAQLYDMFSSEMEAYCLSVAEKLETNFNSWNDTQWLSVWVSCWEKFVMVERGVVPFFFVFGSILHKV
jgi:hypothetical protein